MRITSLRISNIKSIADSHVIDFGPVTLLVGRNNTGKSTVLRSIYALQDQGQLTGKDVRIGQSTGVIEFSFDDVDSKRFWDIVGIAPKAMLRVQMNSDGSSLTNGLKPEVGNEVGAPVISAVEPRNLVYPFLSGRKVVGYSEQVNLSQTRTVGHNLQNLVARVDLLMDRNFPQHETFMDLVSEVIGLKLSAITSVNGKRIGTWVSADRAMYLEDMGEGVAQLLGLITNLCLAHDQIFVIEELENDIHPEALKLVLSVIERSRDRNQFIISTHNNIVLRNLGSLDDTRIYEVTSVIRNEGEFILPTTTLTPVGTTPRERTSLLRHLGYELSDLDLWDGWLILEESSAERIIRDHLVRWFAPSLSRVRVMAANGTGDIDRTFNALYKLVLFTHLEEQYKGRVAVMVDGDPTGMTEIEKLQGKFPSWPQEAFSTFERADFERYYPQKFQEEAEVALALKGQAKREAKLKLLTDVLDWIGQNEDAAKSAFEESAAEVIAKLREFERSLGPVSVEKSADA